MAVSRMRLVPKGTALTKYVRKQLRTYRTVDQTKGPAIYSQSDVYETLHRMGNIQPDRTNEIADFACEVGLVGAKVAGLAQKSGAPVHVTFMDVKPKDAKILETMQREAPGIGFKTVESDFRRTNTPNNRFDTTYCRFAIKNMQPDQQNQALRKIFRVTNHGGVFVLNDMLSPPGLQEFQNTERRAKNSAGGNPTVTHHVPTEKEWIRRLKQVVFLADKLWEQMGAYVVFRRAIFCSEVRDYKDWEPVNAMIHQHRLLTQKFYPAVFPKRFQKLAKYQYKWSLESLKATEQREPWVLEIITHCRKQAFKRHETVDSLIKSFKSKFAHGKRFKKEAKLYITGGLVKRFEQLV